MANCSSPGYLVTYGCNQVNTLDSVYRSAAVDIGTHAIRPHDAETEGCGGCEIGAVERDMILDNDINDNIFDIYDDNDFYDKNFDDYVLLW